MNERVMVFIDGSNFYHGLRKNVGKNLDVEFGKLGKAISGERMFIRTHYYNAPLDQKMDPEKYSKQQRFFDKLRNTPNLKLVLVRMQKRFVDGKVVYAIKGDDIHLATDMVVLASRNAYDTAALVSGDGDFVPAVQAVQEMGKRVENYYFMSGHSWHLRQTCDKSVLMDKAFIAKCCV
jgi:uncharacterized LabA/DUF88 family protein